MPRTTVDIDASVLDELRRRKAREGKALGQLISELLARAMADEPAAADPLPLRWISGDLRPRIDLEDKDALWRALDADA